MKKVDLLFTKDGANTGNAALNTLDEEFSLLSSVAFLRFDTSKHAAAYFLQQILTSQGQQQIQEAMSGNAITRLTLAKISKLLFPSPPTKAEQEAIAEALSDSDALIESLAQLVAKKRQIKQGAIQELLTGKKRLPGFIGEWSIINMNKHATLKARIGWQALTTEEYMETGTYNLVTGTDFIGGRVNWSPCHLVDEWRYKQDRNIQLKNGDVLLTKDGTIGKVGYVEMLSIPATLNSGVFVIRPLDTAFVALFVFYILPSKIFDEFLSKITAGSTITHLYQKDFVTFEFLAPELNEQTAIAAILSDMDAEITALETKLTKTRSLKQGMMHNLLTGRIRLIGQTKSTNNKQPPTEELLCSGL